MNKREVIEYMKLKRREGYITHSMLLDLYEDDEEIPPYMVELVCHRPQGPREPVLIMGREMSLLFNQAMRDYWEAMQQEDIRQKIIQNFKTNKN